MSAALAANHAAFSLRASNLNPQRDATRRAAGASGGAAGPGLRVRLVTVSFNFEYQQAALGASLSASPARRRSPSPAGSVLVTVDSETKSLRLTLKSESVWHCKLHSLASRVELDRFCHHHRMVTYRRASGLDSGASASGSKPGVRDRHGDGDLTVLIIFAFLNIRK